MVPEPIPIRPRPIRILGGNVSVIDSKFVSTNVLVFPGGSNEPYATRRPLWVVSGRSRTNNAGKMTLRINDYLSYPISEGPDWTRDFPEPVTAVIIDSNPRFIASPISDTPLVLTSVSNVTELPFRGLIYDILTGNWMSSRPKEYDVLIEVNLWNLDGTVAPMKEFSWMCFAAAAMRGEAPV